MPSSKSLPFLNNNPLDYIIAACIVDPKPLYHVGDEVTYRIAVTKNDTHEAANRFAFALTGLTSALRYTDSAPVEVEELPFDFMRIGPEYLDFTVTKPKRVRSGGIVCRYVHDISVHIPYRPQLVDITFYCQKPFDGTPFDITMVDNGVTKLSHTYNDGQLAEREVRFHVTGMVHTIIVLEKS